MHAYHRSTPSTPHSPHTTIGPPYLPSFLPSGGSALASDLMWREIRGLSREKPVVASMVDVAASGGYYIAMACDSIVAEVPPTPHSPRSILLSWDL